MKDSIINILNLVEPDFENILIKRCNLLRLIKEKQPIGRRLLGKEFNETERKIRTETNIFKELDLIIIKPRGMFISKKGEDILEDLESLVTELKGLKKLEKDLKNKLNIKDVVIVFGDSDKDEIVFKNLGRKASEIISGLIENSMKITIMSGKTMDIVAEYIEVTEEVNNLLVLPGRSGLGEKFNMSSNTIVSKFAKKIGASYKTLNVPENIDTSQMKLLRSNPQVKKILEYLKQTDLLIFGIGRPQDMAFRRSLPEVKKDEIKIKDAEAEALGYFFDEKGVPIIQSKSIGIELDEVKKIKNSICIAAGVKKAEAIYAFSKFHKDFILITDEETAKKIIKRKDD